MTRSVYRNIFIVLPQYVVGLIR